MWVATTKQVIADAQQLRGLIDSYLSHDLARSMEEQILLGNGIGQNFTGLLNVTGTQGVGPPAAGESVFDVLRKARTAVEVNARTSPTALVLNPRMPRLSTC